MSRADIETAKKYLRRTYLNNRAGLEAYAAKVFGSVEEGVTLTQTSAEGGTGTFEIIFRKTDLLAAIEEVLDEFGNAGLAQGRVSFPDYRFANVT